ncbi:hypothetical protein RSD66_04305 [Brevundimonas sp. S1H14]|uniref:hypothetical protein n=1 Tax=Brevundimonas sp. S1H14 TaxID=3078084 RepID=UPI0039ECA646
MTKRVAAFRKPRSDQGSRPAGVAGMDVPDEELTPPIESAVGDAFGRIAVGAAGRRPCREGDRQARLAFLETF